MESLGSKSEKNATPVSKPQTLIQSWKKQLLKVMKKSLIDHKQLDQMISILRFSSKLQQ